MASVSKTRTGKWAVRYRNAAGKQKWVTVPGPKSNALKVKADIESRQALGHLYEAAPETLGAFLTAWLDRYGQRVRSSTLERRRQALRALGVLSGGAEGLRAARPAGLAAEYLQRLSAAEVEDAVFRLASQAPRQAQIALASLKLALKDAETRGQRFDANILRLKAPRYQEKQPRFLTWPEVERLASWLPEHSKRVVPIAALTGLRQGELFGLLESDLDLANGRLSVRRSGEGPTKTKASLRSVQLAPLAVELIREQLLARKHTADRLVFPAPQGGRWNPNNFMARLFRPALERAGLEPMDFHALRRTYASLMLRAGVDVRTVAAQLGHADGGALLLSKYAFAYADSGALAANALQRMLDDEEEKPVEGVDSA